MFDLFYRVFFRDLIRHTLQEKTSRALNIHRWDLSHFFQGAMRKSYRKPSLLLLLLLLWNLN